MKKTSRDRNPRERLAQQVEAALGILTLNFVAVFQFSPEARAGFLWMTVGLTLLCLVRATAGFLVRTKK